MPRFAKNDIISLIGAAPRYDLGESTGPDLHLRDLLSADGEAALGDLALGYGTAAGDAGLRRAVAEDHGVDAGDVVITVGGMHALFLTAFVLCESGDEAITTSPLFPLSRGALQALGVKLNVIPLSFDERYRVSPDAVRAVLSPNTKLVSLASPQNPSGIVISANTIREILACMEDRCPRAHLLVDETYRVAAYGSNPLEPSAARLGGNVISCASLSKCHGAPGLRLGWAITRDRSLREQLLVAKFNTVISCSRLDETLGLRVLRQQERIIRERRERLAAGLEKTARWVRENSAFVEWVRPDAGALCCVRLKPAAFDEAAVALFYEILGSEGVRVADGAWFGEQSRVFRLGFGLLPGPQLDHALDRLAQAIRRTALRPA